MAYATVIGWRNSRLHAVVVMMGCLLPASGQTAGRRPSVNEAPAANVNDFALLVRHGQWTEQWLDGKGQAETRQVEGEIWNDAIQAALAQGGAVHLPERTAPYYLDAPVILKSGQRLLADPAAEIRLKPGTNTCMVRNEHLVGHADGPVPPDSTPDQNIEITGGIWTSLGNGVKGANGNSHGLSARRDPVPGTHGVILLQNVRRVTVSHVTIRRSLAFAVHLGNVREFLVDDVTLENHGRDGVHVNGPASEGLIRNVRGNSHDDPVSICAWDWQNCAPSFGPVHDLIIEHVQGAPLEQNATDAIRLLPGVKRFASGVTLDCPILDVVLRDITDIREFKFYDQTNLELGRDRDSSAATGRLGHIQMQHLTFTRPGVIKVAATVDGLVISDVDFAFDPGPAFKLVEIGPMSATFRSRPADPASWVEIFSPDRDVKVSGLSLEKVRVQDLLVPGAGSRFVSVRNQHPNPDYPKTTPRGGIGRAFLVP